MNVWFSMISYPEIIWYSGHVYQQFWRHKNVTTVFEPNMYIPIRLWFCKQSQDRACWIRFVITCFKDTAAAHVLTTGTSVALDISVVRGLGFRLSCTIFTGTRLLPGCFRGESSNWCFIACAAACTTFTGWNSDRSGPDGFSRFNSTEVTFGGCGGNGTCMCTCSVVVVVVDFCGRFSKKQEKNCTPTSGCQPGIAQEKVRLGLICEHFTRTAWRPALVFLIRNEPPVGGSATVLTRNNANRTITTTEQTEFAKVSI